MLDIRRSSYPVDVNSVLMVFLVKKPQMGTIHDPVLFVFPSAQNKVEQDSGMLNIGDACYNDSVTTQKILSAPQHPPRINKMLQNICKNNAVEVVFIGQIDALDITDYDSV